MVISAHVCGCCLQFTYTVADARYSPVTGYQQIRYRTATVTVVAGELQRTALQLPAAVYVVVINSAATLLHLRLPACLGRAVTYLSFSEV
jgi:hypothetical protein